MNAEAVTVVLDSFALLEYLEDEAGATEVEERLLAARRSECQVLFSLVNYGECLYIVERERGVVQAQAMIGLVDQLPIEIVEPTIGVFAAAHVKAQFPVSYADAFAISLAQQHQAHATTLKLGLKPPSGSASTPSVAYSSLANVML